VLKEGVDRQAIVARLRENEAAPRARGDACPDSDTDIMVKLDPEAHVTLFDYVGPREYIASQPV
jgi:hypothetical protein